MTSRTSDIAADPPCHVCGYDLRAHLPDGKCPECGASVAESVRLAAIPSRPAWRDSDPRWRRRMLAGIWILAFVPLMDALQTSGLASRIPVPNVFNMPSSVHTLDETFLDGSVFPRLAFCMGVVLLFSRERSRRRVKLDWTRRWGILCTYVVALLSTAQLLVVPALVLTGIAAIFLSMPLQNQPKATQFFVYCSGYLRYGPFPKPISYFVLVAFSSITILLACAPLWDALRSCGHRKIAMFLLAPLALFSLIYIVQAGCACLGLSFVNPRDLDSYAVYFCPQKLFKGPIQFFIHWGYMGSTLGESIVELSKWCSVFAIAIWLSIAQLAARRQRKKAVAE